jgi:hypothetical protein
MSAAIRAFQQRLADARATLGVAESDDAAAIRRAYRRAVAAHPPDRDAEGFRAVRAAYERLESQLKEAEDVLLAETSHLEPPSLGPAPKHAPTALATHLMRKILQRLPLEDIIDENDLRETTPESRDE